jgi:hypothetical protein
MKKLKAHPAAAQARIEKIKFTFRKGFVLKYTNKPKPKSTNAANDSNICRRSMLNPMDVLVSLKPTYDQSRMTSPIP